MLRRVVIGLTIIMSLGLIFGSYGFSYAQEPQTSEQTTLSGDLLNNPLAQDILEKIEQTKVKAVIDAPDDGPVSRYVFSQKPRFGHHPQQTHGIVRIHENAGE